MDLPTNVSTGIVTGRYVVKVIDGLDPNREPDAKPVRGRIVFTASVPYLPNPTATPDPVTIMTAPIVAVLDEEGYLCTSFSDTGEPMYRGVTLAATNDPDLAVQNWTWDVTYMFEPEDGYKLAIPPHGFALPSGSTEDLTKLAKVPSSPGYSLPQAEAAVLRAESIAQSIRDDADNGVFNGEAATLEVGTVSSGTTVVVENVGDEQHAVLNFTLPKGEKGDTGVGVPTGGAPLQLVRKAEAGDDTEWAYLDGSAVGLENADNTADTDKPISNAAQEALDVKADLADGKVPEAQIPARLSEAALSSTIDVRGQARHVKTFGAVGDMVADDTVALTAAIDSGLPLYWGDHRDTYRITGMLFHRATARVEWSSHGATVLLDSPMAIQRAIYLELQGWPMTIHGRLNLDCKMLAHVGLSIVNNSETFVDLRLIDVCVENVFRESSALTGGEAFWIRGAFTTVYMDRPTAREVVMAPGAVVPGFQGVTGINITAFNYLKYPKRVTIIAPEVDGVYDQNLDSNIDQDGIKVFGPEDVHGDLTPNEASFNIIGGTLRNCGGRAVKSQMDWGTVSGLKIYRGQNRAQGGADIDFQVGGGKVTDLEVHYEGNASSAIVNFSGPATAGKQVTHGSVSGIKAVITGDQTPDSIVTFNQRTSLKSNVTVRDVEVVGNQPAQVLSMNGASGGVHSAAISDVFSAPTSSLVRGAFGSPNGWTGDLMAANCLNLGNLQVPLFRSSSGALAAPTVHNVNCVNYT